MDVLHKAKKNERMGKWNYYLLIINFKMLTTLLFYAVAAGRDPKDKEKETKPDEQM